MVENERVRKLRWLCRRGMKELDILLELFIEQNQDSLAKGSWSALESLLQTEDDVLWDWIQNTSEPGAAPYREILEQVRSVRS